VQESTDNLTRALSGGLVTWVRPQVYADWDEDGFGEPGSIDDLSELAGTPLTVEHYLDDGLPDSVTFVAGMGTSELHVPLAGGADNTSAAWYFSEIQTASPLHGYARDVAPVMVNLAAVTDNGPESTRVFTGQMASTPTRPDRSAELGAISATRLKMAKLVLPPVREASYLSGPELYGLNATWLVTWAMLEAGVYPSPPAFDGARLWMTLHGSGNPNLPRVNPMETNPTGILHGIEWGPDDSDFQFDVYEPETIIGPFAAALHGEVTADRIRGLAGLQIDPTLAPGVDWLSQEGNRGRIEFWFRNDETDINGSPGGSGALELGLVGKHVLVGTEIDVQGGGYVVCGVDHLHRPFIELYDGTNTRSLTEGALAADGLWHQIGCFWDVDGDVLRLMIDGDTTSSTVTLTNATLPADNTSGPAESNLIYWRAFLPVAEYQFTTGADAADTNTNNLYNGGEEGSWWVQQATVYPSVLQLEVVAETEPREAWELVGSIAQAEFAAFRTDELDQVLYLPMPYWVYDAQQTVVQTLTTRRDAQSPRVRTDLTKIRNSARIVFNETYVDEVASVVLDLRSPLRIPAGITLYALSFAEPVTRLDGGALEVPTAAQLSGADLSPVENSYYTPNTLPDGTGTKLTASQVEAEVIYWDAGQCIVQFTNITGATAWLANNSSLGFSYLAIWGRVIRISSGNETLAEETPNSRGERTLAVDLPAIQRRDNAVQLTAALAGELAQPLVVIEDLQLFGDPRRQPGDLVSFDDSDTTGAAGRWRIRGIRHTVDGGGYSQTVTLRQARQVGVWDEGTWGDVLWGE
jgi:hypothetical protein